MSRDGGPAAAPPSGGMIIISSPSGAGKSTLTRALLAADPRTRLSVSATTRPVRPGEQDGVHYHFIDDAAFDRRIEDNAFLEWAHVFDHRYGTLRHTVAAWLDKGFDVVFDIDWQGARQLAAAPFARRATVFILPPSLEELERRLRGRAADSEEVIRRRMARAVDEISHWGEYDHVIINDDLDRASQTLQAIVTCARASAGGETPPATAQALADAARRDAPRPAPRRGRDGANGDTLTVAAFVEGLTGAQQPQA